MNLRGIVALIVDLERLAREHFGREHFDGVPGRFGGTGKMPISELPRTARLVPYKKVDMRQA